MRTILLAAAATFALAGAASAQINAPDTSGTIHQTGSLLWPRDDSFAYLDGHGIDKEDAAAAALSYATTPKDHFVSPLVSALSAPTASNVNTSARVIEYGNMPSTWQGDWSTWTAHQDACAAKFRTYSYGDDMFYARPGQRQFCQVGLGDAR